MTYRALGSRRSQKCKAALIGRHGSPLPEFYLQKKFGQEGKVVAVNIDGHVAEFVKDNVCHDEVNKGVAAALILFHCTLQGSVSLGGGQHGPLDQDALMRTGMTA